MKNGTARIVIIRIYGLALISLGIAAIAVADIFGIKSVFFGVMAILFGTLKILIKDSTEYSDKEIEKFSITCLSGSALLLFLSIFFLTVSISVNYLNCTFFGFVILALSIVLGAMGAFTVFAESHTNIKSISKTGRRLERRKIIAYIGGTTTALLGIYFISRAFAKSSTEGVAAGFLMLLWGIGGLYIMVKRGRY